MADIIKFPTAEPFDPALSQLADSISSIMRSNFERLEVELTMWRSMLEKLEREVATSHNPSIIALGEFFPTLRQEIEQAEKVILESQAWTSMAVVADISKRPRETP